MNEFKYQAVNIFLIALLVGGVYWAFTKIDNSIIYDRDLVVQEQQGSQKNEELSESQENQREEPIDNTEISYEVETNNEDPQKEEQKNEEKQLSADEQLLLEKLQGLIDDKIYMKVGSHGTRVGTVQKFLNLYLPNTAKVDNEYGPGTKERVRNFQQKEGLSPDGLAGPETYQKMIEVLQEKKS